MKNLLFSIIIFIFANCLGSEEDFAENKASTVSLIKQLEMLSSKKSSSTVTSTSTSTDTSTKCTTTICLGSYSIYDATDTSYSTSGNGDRIPNKDETIRMDISVGNTGTSKILGLSGTLTTTSNLVTIDPANATKSYGILWGSNYGKTYYNCANTKESSSSYTTATSCLSYYISSSFRITIPNTTPDGSVIPFTLTLTDSTGRTWDLTFNVTIQALSSAVVFGTYSIYDGTNTSSSTSGNGDEIPNKNETVRMNISIGNTGTSNILGLKGTLTTTSNLVTIDPANATKPYGILWGSDYGKTYYNCVNTTESSSSYTTATSCLSYYISSSFRITIPNTTPDGSVIPFTLTLTDSTGRTWDLTFNVTIEALSSTIVFGASSIYDGTNTSYSTSGNNDGIANKNETIRMDISIGNTGTSKILGLNGTLTTTSNLVTIDPANATKSYGTLWGKSSSNTYYNCVNTTESSSSYTTATSCLSSYTSDFFRITIPKTTPDGSIIPFTLTLTDSTGRTWDLTFNVTIQALSATPVFGVYSIYDGTNTSYSTSGNDDKLPNKNETIRMDISVGNTGTSNILGLNGTLTTTSNLVTIDSPNATKPYGTLWGKSYSTTYYNCTNTSSSSSFNSTETSCLSSYANNSFKITIPSTTPDNSVIPFTLALTDSADRSWSFDFSMKVYPTNGIYLTGTPYFRTTGNRWLNSNFFTIYDTTSGSPLDTSGNGDGIWVGNETVRFNLGLKNFSTSSKTISSVVISTTSSYLTLVAPSTINYPAIAASSTGYLNNSNSANTTNTWKGTIQYQTPSKTLIPFLITTTDSNTNTFTETFEYVVP